MLNQCVLSWLVRHLLKLYSMLQSLYFLRRILSFNCISLYACPMLYYCHSDGSSTYVTIFFLLVYTYLVGLLWKCTLQVYIGLIWVHLRHCVVIVSFFDLWLRVLIDMHDVGLCSCSIFWWCLKLLSGLLANMGMDVSHDVRFAYLLSILTNFCSLFQLFALKNSNW